MDISAHTTEWLKLAASFDIQLPAKFLEILQQRTTADFKWCFLDPDEARKLMAELDRRYNYAGREWEGIPFARSSVSEDIVCFDLTSPRGEETRVLPIRDWHGPRWEFSGDIKTFRQWLAQDSEGNLT
jgi:hypothetical protein